MDPKFQELLKTTDLAVLQKMLFEAPENQQKIGSKPLLHLDRWEADPPPDWLMDPPSPR
jgi:hypothetical protein